MRCYFYKSNLPGIIIEDLKKKFSSKFCVIFAIVADDSRGLLFQFWFFTYPYRKYAFNVLYLNSKTMLYLTTFWSKQKHISDLCYLLTQCTRNKCEGTFVMNIFCFVFVEIWISQYKLWYWILVCKQKLSGRTQTQPHSCEKLIQSDQSEPFQINFFYV